MDQDGRISKDDFVAFHACPSPGHTERVELWMSSFNQRPVSFYNGSAPSPRPEPGRPPAARARSCQSLRRAPASKASLWGALSQSPAAGCFRPLTPLPSLARPATEVDCSEATPASTLERPVTWGTPEEVFRGHWSGPGDAAAALGEPRAGDLRSIAPPLVRDPVRAESSPNLWDPQADRGGAAHATLVESVETGSAVSGSLRSADRPPRAVSFRGARARAGRDGPRTSDLSNIEYVSADGSGDEESVANLSLCRASDAQRVGGAKGSPWDALPRPGEGACGLLGSMDAVSRAAMDKPEFLEAVGGAGMLASWGVLYCGGSEQVMAALSAVCREYGLRFHAEKFDW